MHKKITFLWRICACRGFGLLLILSCSALIARADLPTFPYAKVTASDTGAFFFLMRPRLDDLTNKPYDGEGIMYAVASNGSFSKQWTLDGWYAFKVFVSNDGQYLVRIGNWADGDRPSKEDLAVAFYHRGKLIRKYSTDELIKDPSSVAVSISHYSWLADQDKFPMRLSGAEFTLTVIDGTGYVFDVSSGLIKKTSMGRP